MAQCIWSNSFSLLRVAGLDLDFEVMLHFFGLLGLYNESPDNPGLVPVPYSVLSLWLGL